MNEYNPDDIEPKWQKRWQKDGLYKADGESKNEKEYILDMFPYPSGSGLHVGHVEGYTATDIYSRFLRMNGKEVLHPMGWDAFGLPAENFAIKTGTHPKEKTEESIDTFKSQIKRLGLSYDWSREMKTSSPEYYKWTQWLFTKLFKNNLAKKKQAPVNWCPSCQTVLANEQVEGGACERCSTEVQQKELPQWFLTITDYADELVDELEQVDWPESTKKAQKEWIGRSEGAYIDFELETDRRFVLLHGFKSSPDKNFHQHLKGELEKRGYEVEVPALPNPNDPTVKEQTEYVLDNFEFDKNTVLVGHSLGTVIAMKVAERLDQPLAELILIGAFIDPHFADGNPRSFTETFDYEFDFEAIKDNAREIKILEAEEDYAISDEQIQRVHEALGGEHIVIPVEGSHATAEEEPTVVREVVPHVRTFTTRPDTLFGATYLVLAPEHADIQSLKPEIQNWDKVREYIHEATKKSDRERKESDGKSGVKLEGVTAFNPATEEEISVFVAEYVLEEYGTGAIMAVPAHDERDFDFAQKHDLPIKQVVAPVENELDADYTSVDDFKYERAANAVITRESDEKILVQILQMGDEETYKLPGGRADKQESYTDALYRELDEETGYRFDDTVSDLGYFAVAYRRSLEKGSDEEEHLRIKHAFEVSLSDAQDGSLQTEDYEDGMYHEWMDPQTAIERIKETNHFQHEADMVKTYLQDAAVTEDGVLIDSEDFNWSHSKQARKEITDWLADENIGQSGKTYHLRDWSIGRQRYWGTPIPIVYDPDGNPHPIPEEHLPWELPKDVEFEPTGEPPLAQSDELQERTEEIFGEGWRPETDTMDTFVDSSWYYLRFADPHNDEAFADEDKIDAWLPVDLYMGGAEHTVLHLLYARFITKALNDMDYIGFREPFAKLRHQGMILAEDGRKMSKSLGNVVNPTEVIEQFGADAIRLYEMFLGPLADDKPWQTDSIVGVRRFLEKVWRLQDQWVDEVNQEVETKLHKTIKKVNDDTQALKFNTAIAVMMECANLMSKKSVTSRQYAMFLRILAPYAPHMTEELWREKLDRDESIHTREWPDFDEDKAKETTITIAVQIDGTVRDEFEIEAGVDEEAVIETARSQSQIDKRLQEKEVQREIYIDGELVNFVTETD